MAIVKDMQFTRHIYEMQDGTPALGFYLNEYHYVVRTEQPRDKCVCVWQVLMGTDNVRSLKVQARVREFWEVLAVVQVSWTSFGKNNQI